MASADVLKEFLVSLGFKIDPNGERRFLDSVGAATVKVTALGVAATAAATAVVAGTARIAEGLEQLYFASKRTNASVENLQATGFAAKQMGVDAAAALGSVESLARFLRNSPGGEGLLKNLGVNTRDANGAMRDTVDLMGDLGDKFRAMPYYKANAFAQALGIDERTLMAMREGMGGFQQQYKEMLHAAGVDSQAAAKSSHEFMGELRLLGASFGILAQKAASSLTGSLGVTIRRTREMVVANFDRINAVIGTTLDFVGRLVGAIASLAIRGAQALSWLVDWFRSLSPEAQKIIGILGGILIAWKLLSAGFLATPLGRVVALVAALASLWDDYQTWKEGGKSLIDWSAWAPGIEAAIRGIKTIGGAIHEGLSFLGDWRPAFELLLTYVAGKWLVGMLGAIGKVGAAQAAAGGMGLLGKAGLVGAAAVGGWAIGSEINKHLSDGVKDSIGRGIAKGLAFLGNKDAAETLATEARANAAGQSVSGKVSTGGAGPRGIRNNNPGNINYGAWARDHGAAGVESGPGGRFAVFKDAQAGLDALAALLRSYMGRGIDTVQAIISKYAPASDNNNTAAYIASVSKRLGVTPGQHLDAGNMQQMAGIVDAIVRVENGKNPYGREMIDRAVAKGGKPVEVSQTTNIHVNGAGDAKGVAQDVSRAQNDVNEQLVRNMRGAVLQ